VAIEARDRKLDNTCKLTSPTDFYKALGLLG